MTMRTVPFVLLAVASLAVTSLATAYPLDLRAAATPTNASRPTDGTATLYMNLSGTATLGRNSTTTFDVVINITGPVTLTGNNGGGNGKGFSGTSLEAKVNITYTDDQGNVHQVEQADVATAIHGTFAPYLGQGLDGFRYNLEMRGADKPVLHVGVHGNATRSDSTDSYATLGDGNANFKTDEGADNYVFATAGTADLR